MLDHLPAFVQQLAHRSPRTQKAYGAIMASFFAFLPLREGQGGVPKRTDVEAFLARPRKDGGRRSPAGRNQELAALRAFVKFAVRELGWAENPTDGIPFAREAPHDPAVLGIAEVRRLFTIAAEAGEALDRARNLALLALLAQAGLRVHELVALDLPQIDLASATLVGVRGKGGTVHDLPLNAPTVVLLTAYLALRREAAAPDEPALFVSARGGRISVRSVQRLLERLRRAMGTAKRITPHTLRHTAATLALTLGSDLSTVAELLRHADLNTTRRYLHLVDERRREAVRRLGTAIPEGLLGGAPGGEPEPKDPLPAPMATATEPRPANDTATPAAVVEDAARSVPGFLDVQHGLDDVDRAA